MILNYLLWRCRRFLALENVESILQQKEEMRNVVRYLVQADHADQTFCRKLGLGSKFFWHCCLLTLCSLFQMPPQEASARQMILHWATTNLAHVGLPVWPLAHLLLID